MILFINACVRRESRTERLARRLLSNLGGPVEEVRLNEIAFPPVDREFLARRDALIGSGCFGDELFGLARQFARADEIIIAAPYWDLSFPASLKQYIEQINVVGVTFRYTDAGVPEGLCCAKRLTYITTAGGEFLPLDYGFGYIEALSRDFYGIKDVRLVKAGGLDIDGADVEAIMSAALREIDGLISDA